jgi:endonuclease/exonuclease/phosphatase family metal-dependent hydrolase
MTFLAMTLQFALRRSITYFLIITGIACMPVQQPAHLSFLVILAIALALIGGGCAIWEHEIFEEEFDESYQPATFKILTYNIWHGLHVGPYWVRLDETPGQNEARFNLQIRQLAEEAPDLIFLQEVNPLPQEATRFVEALHQVGLEYTEIHQVDACGLRASQSVALLPDLNNGLVILAKPYLKLKKIEGVKILGTFGMCRSTRGFQLEELRYALVGEITWPGTQFKYLVVNVHKHSGLDSSVEFLSKLKEAHAQEELPDYKAIKKKLKEPATKRKEGLAILNAALHKLRQTGQYDGVVLGGDFNFEPQSREYQKVARLGFNDTHELSHHQGELFTLDPIGNDLIYDGDEPLILDLLKTSIAKDSSTSQQELLKAYQEDMRRPKRIDYIFVDSFFMDTCLNQTLFGRQLGSDHLPASDHYGVLNAYHLAGSPEC